MDDAEYKKKIAEKIKERITVLGLSRKQFAAMMNVEPSRITKWLNGTHNFTMFTLFQIEAVLNVEIFNYKQ
jgi:transcriptional regulator with XRE-family HTH domain